MTRAIALIKTGDRSTALARIAPIVREYGPVLPAYPFLEVRDRMDRDLLDLGRRTGKPGAFDLQRGWLFGYLDGREGARAATTTTLELLDRAAWDTGYRQGLERGAADREAADAEDGGVGHASDVPVSSATTASAAASIAPPSASPVDAAAERRTVRTLHLAMMGATVLAGLVWLTGIRSPGDLWWMLTGAATAAVALVLLTHDESKARTSATVARRLWGITLLVFNAGGSLAVLAALEQDRPPHAPLGGWTATALWLIALVVLFVIRARAIERIAHPHGRPVAGARFTANASSTAPAPGELGIVGLLGFAFGGYAALFRWDRRSGRLEFALFTLVGLGLGATALIALATLIVSLQPNPWDIGRLMAFIPVVLGWLWWSAAVLAAMSRRLVDAQLSRWLLLTLLVPLGLPVLAVVLLVAPTRGADARSIHPVASGRAALLDLRTFASGLRRRFSFEGIRNARPNAKTALMLFSCFVAMGLVIALPMPPVVRTVLLSVVGLAFSVAHIYRWVLQERYFRTADYTATYSRGSARAWADPRFPKIFARPHKVLGLVWIWCVVGVAATGPTPGASPQMWCLLFFGYGVYLVWPAAAVILGGGPISFFIFGFIGSIPGPELAVDYDGAFGGLFMMLYVPWALFGTAWVLRILFAGPTDRRTNQYWAYQRYQSESEW